MYFSEQTAGFYDPKIHRTMPDDAVEVTRETYLELLAARSAGLLVKLDEGGAPIIVGPPEPSAELIASAEREWRDIAISQVQWLINRHRDEVELDLATTLTAAQFSELLAYVQSLRDWPVSPLFPDIAGRPEAPQWLAGQSQ
ncbi:MULTISPECIES: tail fiber assembly protein [Gammaproteobacteria]|uniref:tail fiber assembly protein n=1 Tax=Gammaproteobacteria TaxID=1236 RepID=UPI0019125EF8|nr:MULTISPECIES: tail fiber assembly protein [Gammaproteobacteria]MBK5299728.1 tail fiber assembly protein [Bacillus sp. TH86]MBK5319497.1 tail fiber assembly protein [Bacillus sp. TH59]MBK5334447.1 tail fiber assembly protein [Bacillus sp. TH57]MBK5308537.1 tail fiber assembly protein [Pseudomonas sp. TH71]MBK5313996.1 tail fiber assembly protein [Erwinia sp. TH79]